jgi:hypothetical protein
MYGKKKQSICKPIISIKFMHQPVQPKVLTAGEGRAVYFSTPLKSRLHQALVMGSMARSQI